MAVLLESNLVDVITVLTSSVAFKLIGMSALKIFSQEFVTENLLLKFSCPYNALFYTETSIMMHQNNKLVLFSTEIQSYFSTLSFLYDFNFISVVQFY